MSLHRRKQPCGGLVHGDALFSFANRSSHRCASQPDQTAKLRQRVATCALSSLASTSIAAANGLLSMTNSVGAPFRIASSTPAHTGVNRTAVSLSALSLGGTLRPSRSDPLLNQGGVFRPRGTSSRDRSVSPSDNADAGRRRDLHGHFSAQAIISALNRRDAVERKSAPFSKNCSAHLETRGRKGLPKARERIVRILGSSGHFKTGWLNSQFAFLEYHAVDTDHPGTGRRSGDSAG
jgi:hypothetical protein